MKARYKIFELTLSIGIAFLLIGLPHSSFADESQQLANNATVADETLSGKKIRRGERQQPVTLMMRKLYPGGDEQLAGAFESSTLEEFSTFIDLYLPEVERQDFASRARLMAHEIAEVRPDILSLQEGVVIRTQSPADGNASAAKAVQFDSIAILLEELHRLNLNYKVAVRSWGVDSEFTGLSDVDVRYTSSEVILVQPRALARKGYEIKAAHAGTFDNNCQIPAIAGLITTKRGWAAIDLETLQPYQRSATSRIDRGRQQKEFRVVSSHLDFICADVQTVQAQELLDGPLDTELPVILAVDSNSDAITATTSPPPPFAHTFFTPTYDLLVNQAGLEDSWQGDGGETCCYPDDLFQFGELDKRVDQILYRGDFQVRDRGLTGIGIQTEDGRWTSNHAGYWVKITP